MSQRLGQVYQAQGASKRRSIDWSAWLGVNTIANSTWTIKPQGLATDGVGVTPTSTTIQVSGGTPGVTYTIENTIVDSTTQRDKRNFLVTVEG
jgi:hypothetical protein